MIPMTRDEAEKLAIDIVERNVSRLVLTGGLVKEIADALMKAGKIPGVVESYDESVAQSNDPKFHLGFAACYSWLKERMGK